MKTTEFIDRELKGVRLTATLHDTKHWIECYLRESEFEAKRFTVVERVVINSRGGNNDYTALHTDDRAEAETWYSAAEARVKAAIVAALR